jgi:hypothetical protein
LLTSSLNLRPAQILTSALVSFQGVTPILAANLEREQHFVDSVKEFKNFEAPQVAVGENVSTYQNVMDWVDVNDQEIHVEQVSVATWKDGKIVHERFYYDTGNA